MAAFQPQSAQDVNNESWPQSSDGLSVGLPLTLVSPAKTTEPIEIPYGLWTLMGPISKY